MGLFRKTPQPKDDIPEDTAITSINTATADMFQAYQRGDYATYLLLKQARDQMLDTASEEGDTLIMHDLKHNRWYRNQR